MERVFVYDRAAVMAGTAEPDIIPIRIWKEFEELYVSKYITDPTGFDERVFQLRQLKSNRGSYSLAHVVFGITQSRVALKSRIESLQRTGLLPEATQPAASPVASVVSPQLQRREKRSAQRAIDDRLSLEEEEKYAGVPAAARSLVDRVDILTDSTCVMMNLIEEWVLGIALLDERLANDFGSMLPHAFEIQICHELGAAVDRFGEDFPDLLLSSARLNLRTANITSKSSCPQPAQLLKAADLADIYRRYKSSVVGASASRSRGRRLKIVRSKRDAWYCQQLFVPPENTPLTQYFEDRKNYRRESFLMVSRNSLLARASRWNEDIQGADPDAAGTTEPPSKERRRRTSFNNAQSAMLSPNNFQQVYLSPNSVLLLQITKHVVGCSEPKFLLMQHLMFMLFTGGVPTVKVRSWLASTHAALRSLDNSFCLLPVYRRRKAFL